LGYGQNESLMSALEETSKLLNAYVRTILAPDFWLHIQEGYQGRSPCLVGNTIGACRVIQDE
jgi:hypothetical protein